MFGMYKLPVDFLKNMKTVAKVILSLIPSGIMGRVLYEIFPTDLDKIKGIEKETRQEKLDELDRELKIYEE